MSRFPDAVQMLKERIEMMPDAPEVVKVLPVDFLEHLPMVHVTSGGGVESAIDRMERVNVDVYAYFPPETEEVSAEALAGRIHDWLVPGWGASGSFEVPSGLADDCVCDPIPVPVPYPIDDVALVSGAYHVTSRRQ